MNEIIENIDPPGHVKKGVYTPAKKVDLGNCYLVYVSGIQAPFDDNGKTCIDDIVIQTEQVFEDISNILKCAGATLDDVVKAVIYLTDMKDFEIVSPIRAKYFAKSCPTSTMVECNKFVRNGAKIEIQVEAIVPKIRG